MPHATTEQPSTAPAGAVDRMLLTADAPGERLPGFLLNAPQARVGGALGVSILTHAAIFLLLFFVARHLPEPDTSTAANDIKNYNLVFLPIEGPGGGGGGGGNKSPEPPKKVELPGKDAIAVPVAKAPKVQPIEKPKDVEPPPQQLNIPAQTLSAGEVLAPGTLEGTSAQTLSQGTGSGGGGGTGTGTGIGPGTGSGLGPGSGGGTGGGVYRPGSGITMPRVLREVKPQYTSDAMRAKVQGTALLECVVLPDGSVGSVEIVKSLDSTFGLDQEAVKAAKQWRFAPGTLRGEPVPVLVTIELTFTLR